MSKGHQITVSRGEEPFDGAASDLPHMLIVDQHGHYWRAYDDTYSMPPVSDENTDIEIVASYILQPALRSTSRDSEVARIAAVLAEDHTASTKHGNCTWSDDHREQAGRLYDAGLRSTSRDKHDVGGRNGHDAGTWDECRKCRSTSRDSEAKRVGRVFVVTKGDADAWTPRTAGRPAR